MKKVLDKIIPLVVLLPYIEISSVKKALSFAVGDAIISASTVITLLSLVIISVNTPAIRGRAIPAHWRKIIHSKMLLDVYILIVILLFSISKNNSILISLNQWIVFVLPFMHAIVVSKYIYARGLNAYRLAKQGLSIFIIILIVITGANYVVYGFEITDTSSRIISPGGGPVLLGYTIAIFLSVLLYLRPYSLIEEYVYVAVCLFVTLVTGTRGGIWPTMIIIMILITTNRSGNFTSFGAYGPIILIGLVGITAILFPRILDLKESDRLESIVHGIYIFNNQTLPHQLFGTGFGNFFPYQHWLNNPALRGTVYFDYNRFLYNGLYVLAQPHNTYVYLLIETGVIGIVLYLRFLITILKAMRSKIIRRPLYAKIPLILFAVLGFVESTIIIHPGLSALWFQLILLPLHFQQKNNESLTVPKNQLLEFRRAEATNICRLFAKNHMKKIKIKRSLL